MSRTVIVIPCYNEVARLDAAAFTEFVGTHADIDFLFVNDGSKDGTKAVLDALSATQPLRLRTLHLERNAGKGEAVRQGMLGAIASGADFAGFWDADLATPLHDIPEFRNVMVNPAIQAVIGARVNLLGRDVRRKLSRHYFSRIFATAAAASLGIGVYDTQCGAKLFRASPAMTRLFEEPFASRWIFDVEIIARLATLHHGRDGVPSVREAIYEHPLMLWREVAGSKLRLRHYVTVGLELIRIAWRYRRS